MAYGSTPTLLVLPVPRLGQADNSYHWNHGVVMLKRLANESDYEKDIVIVFFTVILYCC